ncbi:glycerophosphodiester phosphodiesterase family protein [Paenibacillus sp. WQ 127069]|uniref:Glycerophosphodiester phosphodiesterase family protein n=1 Tax=Paenibacillus baimaensis TaxID=2982185 RepID=A0ABT2UEM0_9BACL|nr:glycerophosphodiester phosphodiesterase family protein [Paenibacillus sp. WQ 127069]MCU6792084.1 glycerophosphodiester phosphodiesterase family protein [Paenibacillus sp. WQ 127069]
MSVTNKKAAAQRVHWQAHQSTAAEFPENTMAAMEYAWGLGGIPEIDIRQTADGIIIGMHDETPRRTTTASEADRDRLISECTFEQTQAWDAGVRFSDKYRGEKVPSLERVLAALAIHPERELYLDYKQVDLDKLAALIERCGVERQIIFCHRDHENCRIMKRLVPGIRTMLWISGGSNPEAEVARKFAAAADSGFDALDIVQIHLVDADNSGETTSQPWAYEVQREYLQMALEQLADKGLELEVLPFHFSQESLFALLDLGIRRFAVDEPKVFVATLERYSFV